MNETIKPFTTDFQTVLEKYNFFLICLQKGNDLDTVASGLALAKLIELNCLNKKAKLLQLSIKRSVFEDVHEYQYNGETIEKENTAFITVDVNCRKQLWVPSLSAAKKCGKIVQIDHHKDSEKLLDPEEKEPEEITYNLPEYNSCSEIIWALAKAINWKITKEIAEILFYGLFGDSVDFSSPGLDKKTFLTICEMMELGVKVPEIIRKLRNQEQKMLHVVADLIKTSEINGNLAVLNLNPEIIHRYYPWNFKTSENSRRIQQKKLLTIPLNILEKLITANTIIYIHYCLISPFDSNRKYVFVVLNKPNELIEKLLMVNQFSKQRNRFSRAMTFEELLIFVEKNKHILTE